MEPPLQRVAALVTGRRYLLLSVLATAIALASTYQRLLLGPLPRAAALALENSTDTVTAETMTMMTPSIPDSDSDVASESVPDSDGMTLAGFTAELMRSRVSAAIVMHLYSVVMYHVFLAVAHASFGAIRPSEIQQTKETVIHFVLMRCLLLASTMGGSGQKTKMAMLLVWLSAVAFLHGILSLCGARFEHLLTRPMTQMKDLHRLALVLGGVIAFDLILATACSLLSVFSTLVVHFAWFEASLLLIRTLQLGTKVAFHVFDVGSSVEFGSEKGEFYLLVLQTALSGCYLAQLVFYYLYIISVDQFRVSFLDFILIINVKNATVQVLENFKKVKMYHQVVMDLDRQFPDATQEELDAVADDVCVICLKPMDKQAKKLHCGHLFHRFCLRQCLQKASIGDAFTGLDAPVPRMGNALDFDAGGTAAPQRAANSSLRCPICRKHVHPEKPDSTMPPPAPPVLDQAFPPVDIPSPRAFGETRANAQFRDEGAGDLGRAAENAVGVAESETEEVIRFSTEFISRYVPFPNFSFEIVRHRDGANGGGGSAFVVTPEMVQHVWEVFPQYSAESIHADLMHTRSPERTIERILNGRFDAQRDQDGADRGDIAQVLEDLDEDLRWRLS